MATHAARPKLAPGPSRHIYDVIVLGAQLGGALAATLLAKRGYRVLHIEHDGLGPGYEHEGFLLPFAPFVAPPLRSMPAVEEVFVEMGLTAPIQRTLRPHQPELQLVLPHQRLDLVADEARRRSELTREFGPEAAAALQEALAAALAQPEASDAFFREVPLLPPDGMMERWQLRRRLQAFPQLEAPSRLAGDAAPLPLLRGLLPFLVHLDKPEAAPLALTRTLSQVLRSPQRFPGGREGMRELLAKRLTELGGESLSRATSELFIAEELVFEGQRVEGVKLARSDTLYRASFVIAATDAGALRRLIPDKKRQRKLSEHLDGSSTRSFLFAVNWVLPPAALPRGLGELTLLDTQDAEVGPLLLQQHTARTAQGKEDESLRVLCAAGFVPASARELGESHLEGLAARIDGHLEALMPFSRERRVLRSAPYLDASGVRGSRLLPHPLYSFSGEAFLGVTGLGARTPVRNLLLAGREVLPGLGLEGELLSGISAVRLVQEVLKKAALLQR